MWRIYYREGWGSLIGGNSATEPAHVYPYLATPAISIQHNTKFIFSPRPQFTSSDPLRKTGGSSSPGGLLDSPTDD